MSSKSVIIYLTGKPGVGKYTIAQAIAKTYDFTICDNQLINNPIFELLQYDGYAKIPDFAWDSIATIRTEILNFLTKVPNRNYILTNCLAETDEDREMYEQVENMAKARGSIFIPVKFGITKDEHLNRLTKPERRDRWKSIDPRDAEDNDPLLSIQHSNLLILEISDLEPDIVAEKIIKHVNNCNF
jgi:hypothetical protein